ncbi:hypothetical protein GCM10022402_09290 [Salinactinospora qingdaonensis]|uniref:Uncharacterized protein n=1 Tax=Salinactinospora qingdaonensis TaxID=702744 RepID=A0ABP7F5I2_9ACTN
MHMGGTVPIAPMATAVNTTAPDPGHTRPCGAGNRRLPQAVVDHVQQATGQVVGLGGCEAAQGAIDQ